MIRTPQLAAAETWANDHRVLLEAAFARFSLEGQWPGLEQLQHDYEVSERHVDLRTLAWEMSPLLGFVEQDHLVLLIRALQYVPDASPLLACWHAVLVDAYEMWRADEQAILRFEDVLRVAGGDHALAHRALILLDREGWAFNGGGGSGAQWYRHIHSQVRVTRNTSSPNALIVARDNAVFVAPATPPLLERALTVSETANRLTVNRETPPSSPPHAHHPIYRRIGSLWSKTSHHPTGAGVLAIVIAAIIVGIADSVWQLLQ
jgi:hypothetical protein